MSEDTKKKLKNFIVSQWVIELVSQSVSRSVSLWDSKWFATFLTKGGVALLGISASCLCSNLTLRLLHKLSLHLSLQQWYATHWEWTSRVLFPSSTTRSPPTATPSTATWSHTGARRASTKQEVPPRRFGGYATSTDTGYWTQSTKALWCARVSTANQV